MKIINAEAADAHPGRKAGASVPPPAGGSQYCQNHEPGIKHHQPVINHSLIRLPPGNGRLRHTCCKPRRKQQNTVLLQAPLDSVMRKYIISQKEQKQIQSDRERTIFVAYQYAASAVIINTISTQAPLLPIIKLAVGPVIVYLWIFKVLGANIMRLVVKKEAEGGAV